MIERPPVMGGEDFSRYGKQGVPVFMFWLGTIAPDRVKESEKENGKPLPSLHSDQYHPVPEPSITMRRKIPQKTPKAVRAVRSRLCTSAARTSCQLSRSKRFRMVRLLLVA